MITVKNISKSFAETKAVADLSFSIGSGEIVGLLGPNGAGKTTTISILNTTLIKTSGQARLCGFDIEKQAGEVRQRIGVIFQNLSLDRNLTAEENVRFHASLYGLYPFRPIFSLMSNSYKEKVFELAELMGIRQEIFQPIITFSGGMKRKLEIIRGLMHNPRVLFLDEPTTGLSFADVAALLGGLQRLVDAGNTVIVIEHHLDVIKNADYIIDIGPEGGDSGGELIASGSPAKVASKFDTPTAQELNNILPILYTKTLESPAKIF